MPEEDAPKSQVTGRWISAKTDEPPGAKEGLDQTYEKVVLKVL